eukprot:TRINITY_DN8920_c0_g1_i1.p1 TRINITY_DN8920_c0_g1~~TRINITY_DN8920_c0_g1_i1.p1  ORF type:complete len:191 (+),score=41.33 TRINITY_DN8920_c0_g1_i1:188-760(+)
MDEHSIEMSELVERLDTSIQKGLTTPIAERRLKEIGPNKLGYKADAVGWMIFREMVAFHNILIYFGIGFSFYTYLTLPDKRMSLIISLLLVAISFFTIFMNVTSKKKYHDSLTKITQASVLRDGEWTKIASDQLVPGDIIEIRKGDTIPADIRLTDAVNLKVCNSFVNGNLSSVDRTTDCTNKELSLIHI